MLHSGAIWNELPKKNWKKEEKMVHSGAIWNGVLKVGTA